MVEFNYTRKTGGSDKYTVLVVDPDRKNDHAREPQLHGYVIEEMTDEQLINFFAAFRKTIQFNPDNRAASVVEGLNTADAYDSFLSSPYAKDRPYRTFTRSGISQIRQILLGSVGD